MANLTNPQALETWGLRVHAHQVVNFFHSSGVSASVKQLTEYASDTVISILQRGATAEDMGWGLSWEGPIGSCSVTAGVWGQQQGKAGLPPWAWGAAGSQSSKGPVSPRVRWGGSG